MSEVSFIVPGTPVAKGRPRFARRGNYVTAYTPKKTANYESLVRIYASQAMQGVAVIAGAVSVSICLFIAPPASWSKKKKESAILGEIYPTSRPDAENIAKAINDACNALVWADDSQIVDQFVSKRYSESARAVVQVKAL